MTFKSYFAAPEMKKVRGVEEMRVRVENLKKIISPSYVNLTLAYYDAVTKDELDALYLTYFKLRRERLRYVQTRYGVETDVTYGNRETRFDYSYSYVAQSYVTTIDASMFNSSSTAACNTPPLTNLNSLSNGLYF